LAGCSPAEPASAFPADLSSPTRTSVRPAILSERRTVDYTAVSKKGAAQASKKLRHLQRPIRRLQPVPIGSGMRLGTRGSEVQILSPRPFLESSTNGNSLPARNPVPMGQSAQGLSKSPRSSKIGLRPRKSTAPILAFPRGIRCACCRITALRAGTDSRPDGEEKTARHPKLLLESVVRPGYAARSYSVDLANQERWVHKEAESSRKVVHLHGSIHHHVAEWRALPGTRGYVVIP
jgi:hypothetical protein